MREIKFRGKRPHNNKWITGCLVEKGIHVYILGNGHWEVECATEALRDTLGQFTEYKINKKELWEGDIIQSYSFTDYRGKKYYNYHEVKWHDRCKCFYAMNIKRKSDGIGEGNVPLWSYMEKDNQQEIIGNIIDNPELLEVK